VSRDGSESGTYRREWEIHGKKAVLEVDDEITEMESHAVAGWMYSMADELVQEHTEDD